MINSAFLLTSPINNNKVDTNLARCEGQNTHTTVHGAPERVKIPKNLNKYLRAFSIYFSVFNQMAN